MYVGMYVCMYVCMYVFMYVCIYIYIYIHIHMYIYIYITSSEGLWNSVSNASMPSGPRRLEHFHSIPVAIPP